ncbi:hypothetical protein NDU88_001594 [Pleurodeles waltl]|uniref:Uncharacterized protein n=1 Tax=Pleurodeles waltl TaxID=8319 RepID=A0AAV7LA82_PLEWA|nr:hypothetical protein NDU88_001594 [Pleurodeles waltl]
MADSARPPPVTPNTSKQMQSLAPAHAAAPHQVPVRARTQAAAGPGDKVQAAPGPVQSPGGPPGAQIPSRRAHPGPVPKRRVGNPRPNRAPSLALTRLELAPPARGPTTGRTAQGAAPRPGAALPHPARPVPGLAKRGAVGSISAPRESRVPGCRMWLLQESMGAGAPASPEEMRGGPADRPRCRA